jgi:hypothetical protein
MRSCRQTPITYKTGACARSLDDDGVVDQEALVWVLQHRALHKLSVAVAVAGVWVLPRAADLDRPLVPPAALGQVTALACRQADGCVSWAPNRLSNKDRQAGRHRQTDVAGASRGRQTGPQRQKDRQTALKQSRKAVDPQRDKREVGTVHRTCPVWHDPWASPTPMGCSGSYLASIGSPFRRWARTLWVRQGTQNRIHLVLFDIHIGYLVPYLAAICTIAVPARHVGTGEHEAGHLSQKIQ